MENQNISVVGNVIDERGYNKHIPEDIMDENITYEDFLDTCKTNGLLYGIVARQQLFPILPRITLPCRNVDHGRDLIKGFKSEGMKGYFYIRKLSFPEDSWFTRLKNWMIRYR